MPIMHRDDSFATMLLTCALSPDREELVHPLCATEFHELRLLAARAGAPLGQLIGMDMSGVMRLLEVDEMTAYRLCILLGRILPLSYMLESLAEKGVDMVAYCDAEYPAHVKRALPDSAPPVIYSCGDLSLLEQKAVAIVGVSGVKLAQSLRQSIRDFTRTAVEEGYAIVTGGELGVMRVAEEAAAEAGGTQICARGGRYAQKSIRRSVRRANRQPPRALPFAGASAIAVHGEPRRRAHALSIRAFGRGLPAQYRPQARRNRRAARQVLQMGVRAGAGRARQHQTPLWRAEQRPSKTCGISISPPRRKIGHSPKACS